MKTFEIVENTNGIITNIIFSDGTIIKHIDELIEYSKKNEGNYYGEGVHNLSVSLYEIKHRVLSYSGTGLALKVKLGNISFIDLGSWNLDIKADKESINRIEEIFFNQYGKDRYGKITYTPAGLVNKRLNERSDRVEALARLHSAPRLQEALLCATKYPTEGFKPAYSGGIMGSPAKTNKIYRNVRSFDITSSFPYEAITTMVPIDTGMEVPEEQLKNIKIKKGKIKGLQEGTGFLGVFKFWYVERREGVKFPMIKRDERNFTKDAVFDKDGLVECESMTIAACPDDLYIISKQFNFQQVDVQYLSVHKLGLIPDYISEYIKESYDKKQLSTGVEKEEAKQALNTIVGFFGTDPFQYARKRIIKEGRVIYVYDNERLDEKYNKYTGKGKEFGKSAGVRRIYDFRWGAYILASARRRLLATAELFEENGIEVLYSDTDNLKVVGDNKVIDKIIELSNNMINVYGDLGKWKEEPTMKRVVFRGNKTYFYELEDKTRKAVVSGVDEESINQFNKIPLTRLAREEKIEITIKRRSIGRVKESAFGLQKAYAIRELKLNI